MQLIETKDVSSKFATYPKQAQAKMRALRTLIIQCAEELGIDKLEETLKWGEPSYIAPKGSTIRIDWKEKTPDQYAIYFKCTSKLVPSFMQVFGDRFTYENHRAITFKLSDKIPKKDLGRCIKAALTYHKIKQLPLLGLA